MSHADFFSRNPLTCNQNFEKVIQKRVDINTLSKNWLFAEQQRDSEITQLINSLEDKKLSEEVAKTFELRSGILRRKIQRNGRT